MPLTFDQVEQSTALAGPVELFTFTSPTATWRRTSAPSDVTFGGNVYTAVPGGRDAIAIVDVAGDQSALAIDLIASDAIAQNFVNGVPPDSLLVTLVRYHPTYGVSLQFWSGYASAVSFKDRFASFRVPSLTFDALSLDVPSVCATRHCNNVLGDGQCTIAFTGSAFGTPFQITNKTIASISGDGKTIVLSGTLPDPVEVDDAGTTAPYSLFGTLIHTPTGAQRTIIGEASDGKTLTLMAQFQNGVASVGDAVTVRAGCARTIKHCLNRFNNVINFGGIPNLPPSNIFYVGLLAARYNS